MVFDWFNRSAAPQNPEEPQPEQTPQPPAADEAPAVPAPEAVQPEPSLESVPSAPATPTQSAVSAAASASAPAPAVGAVDQDALDWARQAYARLKAQQEAEKQAAAGSPAAPTPAPTAQPASAPPSPESPAPAAPVDVSPSLPAPELTAADAPATPAQESVQSVQVPGQFSPVTQQPAPDSARDQAAPEPSAPPEPPALAAGLSLLEQAAAQRAQRQQELLERAIDVPAAPPPAPAAPVAAPADEAAPQLGAFDEDFTWSAEVLAAQGRQLNDISLEEIDWLGRLRRGMEKTRRGFVTQLLDNLGDDPLTPEVLDDLESLLLRADVGVQATDQVLEALRKRLNEEVVEPAEGIRFLKEQLKGLLDAPIQASGAPLLAPERGRLNVWLMVGVNGVGKTTTLGKLANLAVRSGYSCLIAAADTFRAAAVQQVAVWGERSGVTVVSNPSANADPAAVVFDAIGAAQAKGTDLVLVDTAGRLQTKHNLMEELSKVRRIVDKLAPDAVVQSLLVLDASQGQNGLKQAMAFAQAAGLTGVVITKLDGSSRGGVALAVASEAGLPIRFIGAGEGIRDLRPFNSFEFVEALLAK
ncbi:signal recognition particle-docking protein FtsY [Vulcanococcus sp. Clear-D1]|uniref:signal recognition particle-docking protein FtsY n=1 Tax=Vulcanococcus sp. Clear-D1 TaxID=2766970 RepID=UPI001988E4F9|nr:signal recognition particle-docking protein FtsY [Vulcanococcus sp. Clear-D1]MBD1193882.1 signal recognition particle-docking protein FtsY [Vulcanococcus sp. Clear-D1]